MRSTGEWTDTFARGTTCTEVIGAGGRRHFIVVMCWRYHISNYLMQVVYSYTFVLAQAGKEWSFQTFSFVIHCSPLLSGRGSGACCRLTTWLVCGRWGGETGGTIISGLQTRTHNSNCTVLTHVIVAHWSFQTHGTLLLGLPGSQEVWPRSKTKKALPWLPLNVHSS